MQPDDWRPHTPDNDNGHKLVQDALNDILIEDDKLFVEWRGKKVYAEAGQERTEVLVYELT